MYKKLLIYFLFFLSAVMTYGQKLTLASSHEPQYVQNSEGLWLVNDIHIVSDEKIYPVALKVYSGKEVVYSSSAFQLFGKDSTAYIHYVWIKTNRSATYDALNYVLSYKHNGELLAKDKTIRVRYAKPDLLRWPVSKGIWLAANAPGPHSEHTNTTIKTGEKVFDSSENGWILGHNSQRFAIDFVSMNKEGKLFSGEGLLNTDWFCFGSELYAVADGTVVYVKDNIADNATPGIIDYKITKDNIGGNFVFIDIGNGILAFYGHLKKNSVRVKKGDVVKKGQVIGLLGNSGQSTAPHLHFHLVRKSEVAIEHAFNGLKYEGVPYAFASYQSYGKVAEDFWTETADGKQIIKPFAYKEPKKRYRLSIPINFEVVVVP